VTCIVGVKHQGHLWLGGDSAGSYGVDLRVRADEKVFHNGPFMIGYTTSYRLGQLLRFSFVPPEHPDGMDAYRYMVTLFVDAARECLSAGGYARKEDGVESAGTFLVGYRGELYVIEDDYQVARPMDPYAAVGCAADVALGVLYATPTEEPKARICLALSAAERFSNGVRGPFVIVTDT